MNTKLLVARVNIKSIYVTKRVPYWVSNHHGDNSRKY